MQDYATHELSFVGLQRTGTNYVRQVLRTALPNLTIRNDFWKHAFPEEANAASIGGNVIVVSRHPVLWLQSCLVNSAKDIKESRPEFFPENGDPVIGYANVYNRFYGGWLQHKRDFGAYLLRYEDVLEGDLQKLSKAFGGLYEVNDYSRAVPRLPQSIELSAVDVQAILDHKCSLQPDIVDIFWGHIDPIISRDLSYTLEEINFSSSIEGGQMLRSVAYKLVEKPETLSDEEFALLLKEGKERFQNDGAVLGRIGGRLMKDGDVDGAFDWFLLALLAMRRKSDKVNFGRNLHLDLISNLELTAKATTILKNRALIELAHHHRPKKRNLAPRLQAGGYYKLSVSLAKLGSIDQAIYWGERAIELAKTIPDDLPFTDRWVHHLGHLLVKAGKRSEAIETFREAAAMAPSHYVHHYRLAQEYRALKDRDRALESTNEALRLKPNDGDIIGFKAALLREIDPNQPELLGLARRWVETKPKNSAARFFLSNELRKAGDIEGAIEEARQATICSPETAQYFHHLAQVLTMKAKLHRALAAIDEAILLEPRRARHHDLRGQILIKMKRAEEARASVEEATRCEDAAPHHFDLLGKISDQSLGGAEA